MKWPDGFWWDTGASSAQTEGASAASDWWDWEQAGRVPISGDGNGFGTRYAEDFALLADLGLTHHRLSIDWARIEPEEGERDAAVQHYRGQRQADRMHRTGFGIGLDLLREGRLDVPGREPIERPDLASWADFVGFSYYFTFAVGDGRLQTYPADAPRSPLGYAIHAEGVGLVLDELHRLAPELPIVVAEYGIGTDDDAQRAEYLRTGLATVHDAIERGIDVRGFVHWTAVDNYEWTHGYDVRFGIIDRERAVRSSASVLRAETATS